MLSPIAANPFYWGAPLFAGFLYDFIYGPWLACLAGLLIGIRYPVAAACLGKALEIAVILRFSPRSRGAMLGLMSWLGYASLMLLIVCASNAVKVFSVLGGLVEPLGIIPWPWLGLFLGAESDGTFSFALGTLACWVATGVIITGSVWFGIWGRGRVSAVIPAALRFLLGQRAFQPCASARNLLSQGTPLVDEGSQRHRAGHSGATDNGERSTFQHARLSGRGAKLLESSLRRRHFIRTYILWVLGPKSLASEGAALWITLTWPRGLESLLKAKAWLWSLISTDIVLLLLIYAAFLYPASIWKIVLLGIGWWFFARSMAEKAVTLVRVPSSSGEADKIPTGRRWTAQLGMLTFSIGALTQQWHIAIMGIVHSYVTAAAMWQNFRARMPYLYDPWSETLPRPPTLMHAMIAISILVDAGAVLSSIALFFVGRGNIATVLVLIYATCAVIVSVGVWKFLSDRGVSAREVWCWPQAQRAAQVARPWWSGNGNHGAAFFRSLLSGLASGVMLGLIGLGYVAVLQHIPYTFNLIQQSQRHMAEVPGLLNSYRICAIALAPFAEEYLFRGLLFRALDREWGGWRAVLGSAAFFAIYHPLFSWLPVGLLGIANALLFKQTGRLAPSIVSHMVYNIIVLS